MSDEQPRINLSDIMAEGSTYRISLAKLTGRKVIDIEGYLSASYDVPAFKVCAVVLEDGIRIDVEGEHDFPYLSNDDKALNLDSETIESLWEQNE